MKAFLLSLVVSGAKNIDKPVEFRFFDKIIPRTFSSYNSNIKAIYGENGSGKSGIVHSLKIYRDLIMDENYLYENLNIKHLNELINSSTKKLLIDVEFILYFTDDEKPFYTKHRHMIELTSNKITNSIEISSEKIYSYQANNYQESKSSLIFESKDGTECVSLLSTWTNDRAKNQLNKKSIVSLFFEQLAIEFSNQKRRKNKLLEYENKLLETFGEDINYLASVRFFVDNLFIYMNESDIHSYFLNTTENEKTAKYVINNKQVVFNTSQLFNEIENKYQKVQNIPRSQLSQVISKNKKNDYLAYVNRLQRFIKLFKKDLVKISTEFRPFKDSTKVIAELSFKYQTGAEVFIEFESTGIKKLITLFEAFSLIEKGNIVVIDELDANIHDVYLIKLIEYFSEYAIGQLVFTTHNIGPMEILKSKKHSLDFLTTNPSVTTWTKNGHYSIINLYRKGLLKDLPFNIESSDFIGIFDNE